MSTMTRTIEDIYTYQKQALDQLDPKHPHYAEIRGLLLDQLMDELHEHSLTSDRGTTAA